MLKEKEREKSLEPGVVNKVTKTLNRVKETRGKLLQACCELEESGGGLGQRNTYPDSNKGRVTERISSTKGTQKSVQEKKKQVVARSSEAECNLTCRSQVARITEIGYDLKKVGVTNRCNRGVMANKKGRPTRAHIDHVEKPPLTSGWGKRGGLSPSGRHKPGGVDKGSYHKTLESPVHGKHREREGASRKTRPEGTQWRQMREKGREKREGE